MAKTKPKGTAKRGYEFVVQGTYYAQGDKGKVLKFYKGEKFILPEIVEYVEGRQFEMRYINGKEVKTSTPRKVKSNALRCAKHVLRRYHIEPRLKDKYPDFSSVRIMEIFSKKEVRISENQYKHVDNMSIHDMDEGQLRQFCLLNDINVTLDNFGDLGDKKLAVEMEWNRMQKDKEKSSRPEDPAAALLKAPDDVAIQISDDGIYVDEEDPANQLM